METNTILFFSFFVISGSFILGSFTGWFLTNLWSQFMYSKSTQGIHPEFYDEEGMYINEELLAVRFVDVDDLEDYDEEDFV